MTTNVPGLVFDDTGITAPDENTILTSALLDINDAFGGQLSTNLETPQGQLSSSTTAIVNDKNDELLFLAGQFDPDKASGVFQEAIGKIYYLERKGATATTVNCYITGVAATLVPAGTQAKDSNGKIYASIQDGVINSAGYITIPFQCQETGAIYCPANSLTAFVTPITGVDTITNPQAGVTGSNVETRYDFEVRRRQSVGINTVGTNAVAYANIMALQDVVDCYVIDNPYGYYASVGSTSYVMPPHSIYAAVIGGDAVQIATVLAKVKSVGAAYAGNTPVTIYDTVGYTTAPTVNVKIHRPSSVTIFFAVTLKSLPTTPASIVSDIKNAIISAMAGNDGRGRQTIGSIVYASRFYDVVDALGEKVVSINVGLTAGTATNDYLAMGVNQVPVVDSTSIAVTII